MLTVQFLCCNFIKIAFYVRWQIVKASKSSHAPFVKNAKSAGQSWPRVVWGWGQQQPWTTVLLITFCINLHSFPFLGHALVRAGQSGPGMGPAWSVDWLPDYSAGQQPVSPAARFSHFYTLLCACKKGFIGYVQLHVSFGLFCCLSAYVYEHIKF